MKVPVFAIVWCGLQLWGIALWPSHAQEQNGVVQLRDTKTIVIEGPLLGGQSRRFALIVAYLYQTKKRELTVFINSEGGSFDEANRIIGTMQTFQERGGKIDTVVPRRSICWSFCPMIFSFGDRRFADDETSWMFRSPIPDSKVQRKLSGQAVNRIIKTTNDFWLARIRAVDPQFANLIVSDWLSDGAEHKLSGSELRQLSSTFLSPDEKDGRSEANAYEQSGQ